MTNKTFYLKSMGCKSNQYEGSVISEKFIKSGFQQVFDLNSADFFILNSCSVTHKSDNEALYILRNAKNINNNIRTILTGCLAQLESKELSNLEYIDYVFGNDDKFNIPEFILNDTQYSVSDIMMVDKFNYQLLNDFSKTRYSVKIQDGCDNSCSYCVIPFARGKSRSASKEFILKQLDLAVQKGFKEAVLTGIHIGQWGKEYNESLLDLLFAIENESSIYRYRLGSLNPLEINNDLLAFLRNSNKFCPHFHLSLQSACNKILKSMNRVYSVEFYIDQIELINSMFKNPFLGSDIIVGFPGESERDFEETVSNLNKSGLSKIHVFPYSLRKNTVAESMPGHLLDAVKQQRANIIKSISVQKHNEFINKNLKLENEVIIEKKLGKHTNALKGLTRNYIEVNITNISSNFNDYFNTIQKIKINNYNNKLINAKIID